MNGQYQYQHQHQRLPQQYQSHNQQSPQHELNDSMLHPRTYFEEGNEVENHLLKSRNSFPTSQQLGGGSERSQKQQQVVSSIHASGGRERGLDKTLDQLDMHQTGSFPLENGGQRVMNLAQSRDNGPPRTGQVSFNPKVTEFFSHQTDKQATEKDASSSIASSLYKMRVQQLAEIVSFAPVLKLTVLASANLKKEQVITINTQGVLHGERNELDGYTYFGCKKKAKRTSKFVRDTAVINDFIIPASDPAMAKQQRGRQFVIKFDIRNNFYTIADLGVGFGAFKKLGESPHVLRNNELVNFGLTLCTVKFLQARRLGETFEQTNVQDKEDIIMSVQLFGGASNGEEYHLNPREIQVATLGRSETASLVFRDKLVSKIQCTLAFNISLGWILKDGNGSDPSTNGTWIYLQKEEQIVEGMIIKAAQTVFKASIV